MGFSTYVEEKLLDHLLKGDTFTQPSNIYLALFTADPGLSGDVGEVSGNGYARKLHNSWTPADDGVKKNSGVCTFSPCVGASWGTITHFGLFDALTGGNFLGGGALTAQKVIAVDDIPEFADQSIAISLV